MNNKNFLYFEPLNEFGIISIVAKLQYFILEEIYWGPYLVLLLLYYY